MNIRTGWCLTGVTVLWIAVATVLAGNAETRATEGFAGKFSAGAYRPLFPDTEATWKALRTEASPTVAELRGLESVLAALDEQWQSLRAEHERILNRHLELREALGDYEVLDDPHEVVMDPKIDFQQLLWRDGEVRLIRARQGQSIELDRMSEVLHAFAAAAKATVHDYIDTASNAE